MNEKVYKTLGFTGGVGIALGIIELVFGVVVGVITIIGGAKLLRSKSKLTF